MSLGKKGIIKNISTKTHLSKYTSTNLFESFVLLIKSNARSKKVKISNFGTFQSKISPKRIGRNPKTKKLYPIPKQNKITFKASNTIKSLIN